MFFISTVWYRYIYIYICIYIANDFSCTRPVIRPATQVGDGDDEASRSGQHEKNNQIPGPENKGYDRQVR